MLIFKHYMDRTTTYPELLLIPENVSPNSYIEYTKNKLVGKMFFSVIYNTQLRVSQIERNDQSGSTTVFRKFKVNEKFQDYNTLSIDMFNSRVALLEDGDTLVITTL